LCSYHHRKTRYEVINEHNLWEIDVFKGNNKGLIIAEIELISEVEKFKMSEWIGKEVSNITMYYNSNLVQFPYIEWHT
jgi:adenylate cyclase